MANSILEALKKSRQFPVKCDHITLTLRRPTHLDVQGMGEFDFSRKSVIVNYVVGWAGVTEADILPNGDDSTIDFDLDLFQAWIADKPEYWARIGQSLTDAYLENIKKKTKQAKP
jgi:hypothetical protein